MFLEIFRFELRYQFRQPLFWLSAMLFFLLAFGAVTTDAVQLGGLTGLRGAAVAGLAELQVRAPALVIGAEDVPEPLERLALCGAVCRDAGLAVAHHARQRGGPLVAFLARCDQLSKRAPARRLSLP